MDLVKATCLAVQKDVAATIEKINSRQHPYVDRDDPSLYVFVYDAEGTVVAHPDPALVGRNFKGQPDEAGKCFSDDILTGALERGEGWVGYVYRKPGEVFTRQKSTFYKRVTGSDGKTYIVCSGRYKQ